MHQITCQTMLLLMALTVACSVAGNASGQSEDLSVEQAQLAEKYERLETLAVRIAELVEQDSPDRAEQLRSAIAESRSLALADRFDAIVDLLREERFAAAGRDQGELADSLDTLLALLLADPHEARLEAERRMLKQAIKDVGKLIRRQGSLRGQTLEMDDPSEAAQDQESLAEEAEQIKEKLGEPGQGQKQSPDPSQQNQPKAKSRAAENLQKAKEAMGKASGEMSEGDCQGASQAQTEAQRALEQAREELEEALRQTREEEQMRTLTRLAARLRRILGEQAEINRLTVELQEVHGDQESIQKRSAAAGLAQREDEVTAIADGALRLLEEDGRSVAFVEVLEQARQDMVSASGRLNKGQTGEITQAIERDIVDALQEAVDALDQQLSEMAERQQQGQPPRASAQSGEPPLVDQLAELRMLRSLQQRILSRTERYNLMADAGELSPQELSDALADLSQRQRRAIQAAQALAASE